MSFLDPSSAPLLRDVLRPLSSDFLPVTLTPVPPGRPKGDALALEMRYRPEKGVAVRETLRFAEKFVSGRGHPVVHVLGWKTEPITLTGRLNDRADVDVFATDGPLGGAVVNRSRELGHALRRMMRRGDVVLLEWGTAIAVEGLITEVEIRNRRESDMTYEIRFLPIRPDKAPGDAAPDVVRVRGVSLGEAVRTARGAILRYEALQRTLSSIYQTVGAGRLLTTRRGDEDALETALNVGNPLV